jgi:tetratricopeptide (TPR) repeat protein
MKKFAFSLTAAAFLAVFVYTDAFAQNPPAPKPTPTPERFGDTPPPPPPKPKPSPTPRLSSVLTENLVRMQSSEITRERREQAYAKMLEGQRYVWQMSRSRTPSANLPRLAQQAFQKAVELDPNLAEGYTALAELALSDPRNGDLEEALMLANIAAKINPNSFGARRILARLYTIKSRLNSGVLDTNWTPKAISEWREVARLDPRNAEAWAFLSEFYDRTGKTEEKIIALNRWLASASPLDPRFYRTVLNQNLSIEAATVKLGAALVKANRLGEAVEILSRAVADEPDNTDAVDLLREAIEGADAESSAKAVQALQQAIYANPTSFALVELLADTQARAGRIDDAAKTLRAAIARAESDKNQAASLFVALGDVYANADRTDEAVAAFEESLKLSGVDKNAVTTEVAGEFAATVFRRMITAYKNASRYADAKAVIDRARSVLDKEDSFADKQQIALLLETGKRQEALQFVRASRLRFPTDESLLRQEAMILADSGKVEEGVALVKTLLKGKTSSAPSALSDDYSNLLYISALYNQAKRGREAMAAANEAYALAQGEERKQIAKLTLATAQHQAGEFAAAETTLREILKQTPGNPIALNNLGYFLLERNERFDEALKLIQQAVKIDPTNPSYLDSLGWAYFKLGKYDEAEKYLRDAARRSPDSATIYEHLGDVYQKQNKTDLAKKAWQKALNLASDAEDVNRIKEKLGKKGK